MNALDLHLEEIKKAYQHDANPSIVVRKERIGRIVEMINKYEENLCKVVLADFGNRHHVETRLAELNMVKQAAKYALKNLETWMQAEEVDVPMHLKPSKAYIQTQPKGVIGIMSPWNYPIQLALVPAIAALAAGNRVWLKPSERTPRTAGYLATMIAEYFHPLEFSVTVGDASVGKDFAGLAFDHLLFTGSTATGKQVMRAAAENLTPVTLELGGKSPAIVHDDAPLEDAAKRIIYGKLFNNGQTCVAPDYVLIKQDLIPNFLAACQKAAQAMYANPDELTHPIDQAQLDRWQYLTQEAVSQGAQLTPLLEPNPERPFTPTILTNVSANSLIMQEEIFGPILPVIGIKSAAEVIEYIQSHERPLAMYWFGKNKKVLNELLLQTHSGGVTVNDTLLHITLEGLPFGGIGHSGMGHYHGHFGFKTFSHHKPVLETRGFLGIRQWMGTSLAHPPYGKTIERLIRRLGSK